MSSFVWRADLAYVIGLIATDGCLSPTGRHIVMVSKDRDQLETFRKILGLEHIKIGSCRSGREDPTEYYRVQFGDVSFYKWLLGIGLTPNKSKTIGQLKIPDEHFFDFLRGCFDGDGSVYSYWDPRWKSSYMFYLVFTSASACFVEWLQTTIHRLCGARGRITWGARVFQLRYAKRETALVCRQMYRTTDAPCLKRKFVKVQKIFAIDESHNRNAQVAELAIRATLRW